MKGLIFVAVLVAFILSAAAASVQNENSIPTGVEYHN